jgi:hypothetical protein
MIVWVAFLKGTFGLEMYPMVHKARQIIEIAANGTALRARKTELRRRHGLHTGRASGSRIGEEIPRSHLLTQRPRYGLWLVAKRTSPGSKARGTNVIPSWRYRPSADFFHNVSFGEFKRWDIAMVTIVNLGLEDV